MTVALYILVAFGVLLASASLTGVLFPMWLVNKVKQAWQTKGAMCLAVAVRIVLGVLLIACAPQTLYPTVLRVIGTLGLVAAIGLPLIGWQNIDNLMGWFQSCPPMLIRAWCVFGMIAGAFLAYASI